MNGFGSCAGWDERESIEPLQRYAWPGNGRELRNHFLLLGHDEHDQLGLFKSVDRV